MVSSNNSIVAECLYEIKVFLHYVKHHVYLAAIIISVFVALISFLVMSFVGDITHLGVLFIFFISAVTIWGFINTLLIIENQGAKVSNFDDFLDRLTLEIREIYRRTNGGEDKEAIREEHIRMLSYTPAIGNISAQDKTKFERFKRQLLGAVGFGVKTTVVCLNRNARSTWHKKYSNGDTSKETEWETHVSDIIIAVRCKEQEGNTIKEKPDEKELPPVFIVLTSTKGFYFVSKPKTNGKKNEGVGLCTSDGHVKSFLESFVEYYLS